MPSNYTANYHLNQWAPGDKVLRTDFNQDNAAIDAAIKAEADALTQAMNAKADKSALDALSKTVSGQAGTLARKGNCRIYYATYIGDGSNTSGTYQNINFPGKPMFVVIGEATGSRMLFGVQGLRSGHQFIDSRSEAASLSWSGNTMGIRPTTTTKYNENGLTYTVLALIAADQ